MTEQLATIPMALHALARNKLRSALTMFGIVIGVSAVIAMMALGQGAKEEVQKQIAALGSNLLTVGSGTLNKGGVRLGLGNTQTLTMSDMQAILRQCPAVAMAAPGSTATAQVVFGNDNWRTKIIGTEPAYFDISQWAMSEGAGFTQEAVDLAANVAVIGVTVRKNLFGAAEAVGQTLRVNNLSFRIIGVLNAKGQSAATGEDQDDVMYVPITTLQRKITGQLWLRYIYVSATSRETSYAAQRQIQALLSERHKKSDDFYVRNFSELAEVADQSGNIITLLLASIASISLLVGGIGIMNIMLVSVHERTREIGVRLAIGASEADVQLQFLAEAMVLSIGGGVAGVALGIFISYAIPYMFGWVVSISTSALLTALSFSVAVGVFFGYYPARKAAALNPIEALRYE